MTYNSFCPCCNKNTVQTMTTFNPDDTDEESILIWKCDNCGNLIDFVKADELTQTIQP